MCVYSMCVYSMHNLCICMRSIIICGYFMYNPYIQSTVSICIGGSSSMSVNSCLFTIAQMTSLKPLGQIWWKLARMVWLSSTKIANMKHADLGLSWQWKSLNKLANAKLVCLKYVGPLGDGSFIPYTVYCLHRNTIQVYKVTGICMAQFFKIKYASKWWKRPPRS